MSGPRRTICHLSVASHLGGGERSLLDLARTMRDDPRGQFSPWVVLPGGVGGPLARELLRARVDTDVIEVPGSVLGISRAAPLAGVARALRSGPAFATYFARLLRALAARDPVLIHTNGLKSHFIGAAAGAALGLPVVWHLRDIYGPGPVRWALHATAAARGARGKRPVRLVANSRASAAPFAGLEVPPVVVHNGLDPSLYSPARNDSFRECLRLPPGAPVVGILGVLARWKGQLEFLQMAARLVREGADAGFVVAGGEIYDTGSDRGFGEELEREAGRLGIRDRVIFTGFVERPQVALAGMDVLVHASIRPEPFGRTVVEGMACEVPVVASGAGGILEVVDDGVNGLLYPPGDVGAMAAAVRTLLRDPALRERLARAARLRFEARFTLEAHYRGMLSVFGETASR